MKRVFIADLFESDLDRMARRGHKPSRAYALIAHIREHGQAPTPARPHKLSGVWAGYWECHIGFDWLLIYTVDGNTITLWRTGTHDDLLG